MPIALLFYLVTAVAAALAIGVGVLLPALGQTHAAMRAMRGHRAPARRGAHHQPEPLSSGWP